MEGERRRAAHPEAGLVSEVKLSMGEAVRSIGCDSFTRLCGKLDTRLTVDGAAVAGQTHVSGAGVENVPLLGGHGVRNGDGRISGHVDPGVSASESVVRGLGCEGAG